LQCGKHDPALLFDAGDDFFRSAPVNLHDGVRVHGFEVEDRRVDRIGLGLCVAGGLFAFGDLRFQESGFFVLRILRLEGFQLFFEGNDFGLGGLRASDS
jgi:hypothetical protein